MKRYVIFFVSLCLGAWFFSCSTPGFSSSQNWSPALDKQLGAAEIGAIRVDKNADWDSVEAETRRLLPLLLSKAGYTHNAEEQEAFTVDAVLIEREYMENWKIRRSLSAEIVIRKNNETIAAGKALLTGTKSLSSSKVLHKLLESALNGALKALGKT
jgi:hypothetical protein